MRGIRIGAKEHWQKAWSLTRAVKSNQRCACAELARHGAELARIKYTISELLSSKEPVVLDLGAFTYHLIRADCIYKKRGSQSCVIGSFSYSAEIPF